MKTLLLATVFLIGVTFFGCKSSAANHSIEFVDRSAATSHGTVPRSLLLVIEIDEGGGLRLNKIETGTINDVSQLAEKLKVVFADREKAGINEREVLIDPKIHLEAEGFEELVRTLAEVKASPIRVIRNDR